MADPSISIKDIVNIANQTVDKPKKSKKDIDTQEDFLLLLVTQLKYQDPMEPMKAQEFAAQLAQFSSVERLMNIEKALTSSAESNKTLSETMNNNLAATLIGKMVRSVGNKIDHSKDGKEIVQYDLKENAANAVIVIKDNSGTIVRQFPLGKKEAGKDTMVWDGKDGEENSVESGWYTFEVIARDGEGNTISVDQYQLGRVDGVRYAAGDMPKVIINGDETPLSSVMEIWKELVE